MYSLRIDALRAIKVDPGNPLAVLVNDWGWDPAFADAALRVLTREELAYSSTSGVWHLTAVGRMRGIRVV